MQLAFGAIRDPQRPRDPWSRLHEALVNAIILITPKELCFRLNIKATYLNDALEGKDRKGVRAEWIPVILAMAPDHARAEILTELASPVGFEVQRKKTLTAEEKLERAKERLRQRFGQAGLELIEELDR